MIFKLGLDAYGN